MNYLKTLKTSPKPQLSNFGPRKTVGWPFIFYTVFIITIVIKAAQSARKLLKTLQRAKKKRNFASGNDLVVWACFLNGLGVQREIFVVYGIEFSEFDVSSGSNPNSMAAKGVRSSKVFLYARARIRERTNGDFSWI